MLCLNWPLSVVWKDWDLGYKMKTINDDVLITSARRKDLLDTITDYGEDFGCVQL